MERGASVTADDARRWKDRLGVNIPLRPEHSGLPPLDEHLQALSDLLPQDFLWQLNRRYEDLLFPTVTVVETPGGWSRTPPEDWPVPPPPPIEVRISIGLHSTPAAITAAVAKVLPEIRAIQTKLLGKEPPERAAAEPERPSRAAYFMWLHYGKTRGNGLSWTEIARHWQTLTQEWADWWRDRTSALKHGSSITRPPANLMTYPQALFAFFEWAMVNTGVPLVADAAPEWPLNPRHTGPASDSAVESIEAEDVRKLVEERARPA